LLLQHWIAEDARSAAPAGRWAIERRRDGRLLGGAILLRLPPGREDLELGWQLHPQVWGVGYASETTRALANWAFSHDVDEIFAVVRPGNTRAAATVRRNGMEWVGETDKYFGRGLQVFRLRRAALIPPHRPPRCPQTPPPRDRPDRVVVSRGRGAGVAIQARRRAKDSRRLRAAPAAWNAS